MDELNYIEQLERNNGLFEEEFSKLSTYYKLTDKDDIHDFVSEHRGLIVLLDAVKPYLEKTFPDDEYDLLAEERFATKEMDVYAFALKKLLSADVANKRLSFISDENKKQRILSLLQNVSIEFKNINKHLDD